MKKLLGALIVLAVIAIVIRVGFNLYEGGYNITYELKDNDQLFKIVETFKDSYKSSYRYEKDLPTYLFDIYFKGDNEPSFVFKLMGNYNYYQRIIKDIKYYKDNKVKCIYPVLKVTSFHNDVMCIDNNELTYYTRIKGKYSSLDNFVNNLNNEYGYTNPGWLNDTDESKSLGKVEVYRHNIKKEDTFILWNYNGIRTVTKTDSMAIILLLKDNYDNKLGALVGHYYVVPNYNKTYSFNKFFVYDIDANSKKEILLDKDIAMDSYIQGVVNNKLYLFDRSNKIQYEIDPEAKTYKKVSNSSGVKYYDGTWSTISVYDALDNKIFKLKFDVLDKYKDYKYYRIDSILGDKDGYYYFYVKTKNKISVYRADKQRPEYVVHLFDTNKIDNIKYVYDYLYFIKDDTIYMYHETMGLHPVLKSFELFFNKTNAYDVYSK